MTCSSPWSEPCVAREMEVRRAPLRCPCGAGNFSEVFRYDVPPEGEVRFGFSANQPYRRSVLVCGVCGHFISMHAMGGKELYGGDYVASTYGEGGITRAFERIVALDPSRSDNVGRVRRIAEFMAGRAAACRAEDRCPSVLDVGSGLCVFLHGMKAEGWDCTALDPDARAARHARDVVGVRAVCGDFMARGDFGAFDLVTFNKVLEHVEDPVAMLAKSSHHLREGGVVYVEVPDGELAVADGSGREEFFIDHHHIFSAASLALLAARAGFSVSVLGRLREPSEKYTLWSFLRPTASGTRAAARGGDGAP